MTNGTPGASPLELAAQVTDERVTEVFSLLGDETRLAIVLALWEAGTPFKEGSFDTTGVETLPFSMLRERVGSPDPGNFNYHLGQLEGQFIEHTDEGYELLPAGRKIVSTVLSIAGFDEDSLSATAVDLACPNCGAPTAVTYQKQRLYHHCTACEGDLLLGEGHPSGIFSAMMLDRSILSGRSAEEIILALYAWKFHAFALAFEGVCITCSGPVTGSLHVCDDHRSDGPCSACGYRHGLTGRFTCSVCRQGSMYGIIPLSAMHPAVMSFAWAQGFDMGYGHHRLSVLRRLFELYERADDELIATDPPRARVTFRDGESTIELVFDETMQVVEVDRDIRR